MTDTRYRSHVSILDIEASPTNPRKHFDEDALNELASNIKTHGVITPILLRTAPAGRQMGYEIISGERRWRAAQIAGLKSIPAIIRDDLSDAEILELQIIENLQRADLHPIEEAEGYGLMMREHGYTADALAEKIGKSRSYIFGRMKLLDLDDNGRRLFRGGLLTPSTALLIARIPTHALQAKAIEDITRKDYRGEVMSFRTAASHIQNRYMTRLDNAPFPIDAPDLIATAGGCTACPKRTGNTPDLFDDIESENVCTDPDCFAAKRMAQAERRKLAAGSDVKIITGDEADRVMPSYSSETRTHVRLDSTCYDDPERRTYRQIMGEDKKGIALVEQRDKAELLEVVEKKAVAEKLRNAGVELRQDKDKAEAKKRQAKLKLSNAWRDRLFREIKSAAYTKPFLDLMTPAMPVIAHRFLVELGAERGGQVAGLWGALGSDNYTRWEAFKLALPSMPPADLLRFCLDCALISEHKTDEYHLDRDPACMITVATALGIDHEALMADEKAAQKAAESTKKPAKKAKKSQADTSGEALYPSEAAQAQDLTREKTPDAATEAAPAGDETAKEEQEESPASAGEGDEKPNAHPPIFWNHNRVRITVDNADEGLHAGDTGTVKGWAHGKLSGNYLYTVQLDAGGEIDCYGDEIEMNETPKAAEPPPEETTAEPAPRPARVTIQYQHPNEPSLQWSGRGRKPKWVEAFLAQGNTLDNLKITGAAA